MLLLWYVPYLGLNDREYGLLVQPAGQSEEWRDVHLFLRVQDPQQGKHVLCVRNHLVCTVLHRQSLQRHGVFRDKWTQKHAQRSHWNLTSSRHIQLSTAQAFWVGTSLAACMCSMQCPYTNLAFKQTNLHGSENQALQSTVQEVTPFSSWLQESSGSSSCPFFHPHTKTQLGAPSHWDAKTVLNFLHPPWLFLQGHLSARMSSSSYHLVCLSVHGWCHFYVCKGY